MLDFDLYRHKPSELGWDSTFAVEIKLISLLDPMVGDMGEDFHNGFRDIIRVFSEYLVTSKSVERYPNLPELLKAGYLITHIVEPWKNNQQEHEVRISCMTRNVDIWEIKWSFSAGKLSR